MKKVLIISYFYYQKNQIASYRIHGLIKYLPDYGWDVILITIPPKTSIKPPTNIQVISHEDRISKWKKKLGIKNEESFKIHFNIKSHKSKLTPLEYILKIFEEIYLYPDHCIDWNKKVIERLKNFKDITQIDAIISTSGPPTCHIIASNLCKTNGIPWIADFRDLWTQWHNYSYSRIRKKIEVKLETKTILPAKALITVSNHLANRLIQLHKMKNVYVIPNGFDPDQLNRGRVVDKKFRIIYTGTIYRGKQDPEPLFSELRLLCNEDIITKSDLCIDFYGDFEEWLFNLPSKYNLEKNITIHSMVDHDIAIIEQQQSQLLLLLNWNDPKELGIYTGKVFEYLAARRPILSIGYTRGGVVKELLDQTKAGVHCASEADLREYLLKAYQEYKELGAVQYRGVDVEILKYSHKEMARKFAEVLEEVTNKNKQSNGE